MTRFRPGRHIGPVVLATTITLVLALDGCGGGGQTTGSTVETTPAVAGAPHDFGRNDPFRVVAFGDSITRGVIDQGIVASRPYPEQLQTMLARLDRRYRVINRGSPGEDTTEGLQRFSRVVAGDRAGYVLLMEGTNDATLGERPGTIAANLRTMTEQAKANQTVVVLATIPPNFRSSPTPSAVIQEANPLIRSLASEQGLVLAEIFDGMNDRRLFFGPDPLHPTQRGYDVMAGIWFTALQQAIERSTPTVVAASGRSSARRLTAVRTRE